MVAMPTDPKYRLRRKDRAEDRRAHTYATEDEANEAYRKIPSEDRDEWEVVEQRQSGSSGPSTPHAERKKKLRGIGLDDEMWALIGRAAEALDTTRTGIVESAVTAYAKKKKIT